MNPSSQNPSSRSAFVAAARLDGWVARFAASHRGLASTTDTDDGVLLAMRDGATALLTPPWPDDGRPGRGAGPVERLVSLASQERRFGLVLVRRGGYGVGVAAAGKLLASKVGTASSRSRGGDPGAAVVERAAAEALKVFAGQGFEYLATGGDKLLVEAVLAVPALRSVRVQPRLDPLAVPDPKMAVLEKAAADFCAVRVRITDPAGP
ncbi:hypothetical protein JOF48_003189 [Arthrobacter stackebrandtii]|uniref:Actinobacteria/chloroflexi VLRF1 release factor domain-containing protein n=1 Tax=Arthrobacter stackebrandtii TaxID=272161 RepID=A0ABS4Z0P0_9MICC|nr:hypothetical protein [Arthrobacter stackebrandtii]PYH01527.1 hypothetical protein CVV67_03345 [Arthrobacter stackebrandtii]